MDLMENVGSGVLRILKSYDKKCFNIMENSLRVSFKFVKNPFEYSEDDNINGRINGRINGKINGKINDEMNDKISIVKQALKENPQSTILELSINLGLSQRTVSRCLKQLHDDNEIERIGSKKTGYWKILK